MVMDTIWNRFPSKSEVIGRCGRDEKTIDPTETTKVNPPPIKHPKTVRQHISSFFLCFACFNLLTRQSIFDFIALNCIFHSIERKLNIPFSSAMT